ncbi:DNA binding domain-containing protein, excisionase family [Daejeonella rubra]|uniref:DNA binding domain-containing protein, excisionase family n=1 Tax=Daejeonella rubra TaxID=990371 RepID=A0A1G9XTV6_9SPHI|nr:helix-turn-helix domain-containing protein [Daejeonella rubra]SDM99605.1 DNA binding domain-containing protein, excisionase family [Daejeonella rubra]
MLTTEPKRGLVVAIKNLNKMQSREYNDLEKAILENIKICIREEVQKILQMHIEDKAPLLTIKELAEKLKVTKATIHNYLKKGLITGEKMGKNRYFEFRKVLEAMKKYGYHESNAIGRLIIEQECEARDIQRAGKVKFDELVS